MLTFISVVHIIVALLLIGLVLIQDSKGGGALGIGGGSNSVLGATGAQTLWAKMTQVVAVIFAITCIALTYFASQGSRSVIENTPAAAAIPMESVPAAPGTNATAGATEVPAASATTETPAAKPAAPAEKK